MASGTIYLFFLGIELLITFFVTIYLLSLLYSSFNGAPFVPSSNNDFEETLAKAFLKKDQLFLELGSGDGRVVSTAVKKYQVRGIGIEISPLLVWYSRFLAKIKKINYIEFRQENIYKTDISKADVIYMFLMPKMLEKLKDKLSKEAKKGALIISHGFRIHGWEKILIMKEQRKLFSSFFYKKC